MAIQCQSVSWLGSAAAGQWQFEGFGNVVVLVGEVLAGERAAHLLRCQITDASRPSRATPRGGRALLRGVWRR